MSQLWTITDLAGTQILYAAFVTPSVGSHPKDNGWAWDAATQKCTRIDAAPDLTSQKWSGTAWVEDLAKVKAASIAQIKADKAAMLAAAYTTVFGKQKIYARKQEEVNAFRALAPLVTNLTTIVNTVAFTSLGVATQKDKFRFALAEAALRGVSVGVVINEYATRIDGVEPQSAAWEAIEQKACADTRAATSSAQVKAIYAAINWAWTVP